MSLCIVTPKTKAKQGAIPHLKSVSLWNLGDFVGWAKQAMLILRKLRTTFEESGNLAWRREAEEEFKKNKLDATSLLRTLKDNIASEKLESVK